MKKYQQITLREFKGVNTVDDPATIEDNELQECVNFDITDAGTLRKRSGAQRVGNNYPTGSYIGGIRLLGRHRTATEDKIYFTDGSKLWRDNTITFDALEEITDGGASIPGASWGFQSRDNFQITQFSGMNLGVAMGSAAAIPGNGPDGTFALAYKTRMWVINTLDTTGLEYRLYFSALGVFDTWTTATDFIDVGYGDGTPIVSMAVLADTLYIFKTESVWSLQADGSPSNWVLRQVNPTVGCVGRGTVQVIDGMIYFLSRTGVYRTDGTTFEEVSGKIRNQFVSRSFSNREDLLKPDAGYYDNKYLVFPHYEAVADNSGLPTYGWAYHIARDGWTQYQVFIPYEIFGGTNDYGTPSGFVTISEYDTEFLYFGHTTVSLIFRFRADNTHHTDFGRELVRAQRPYTLQVRDFGESDQGFPYTLSQMGFTYTGDVEVRKDISNVKATQSNGIRFGCIPAVPTSSAEIIGSLGNLLHFGDTYTDHEYTFNYSYDDSPAVQIGHELVCEIRDNSYSSTGNYLRFGFFYILGDIYIGVRQLDGGVAYGTYFATPRVNGNSEWLRLYWDGGSSTLQLYHGPFEGEYDAPINVAHYPSWTHGGSIRFYTRCAAAATQTNFYLHRLGAPFSYYDPARSVTSTYKTKDFDFGDPSALKNHVFSMVDMGPECEPDRGNPYHIKTLNTVTRYNYEENLEGGAITSAGGYSVQDWTKPYTRRTRHTFYGMGAGVVRHLADDVSVTANTPVEVFSHTIAYSKRGGTSNSGN